MSELLELQRAFTGHLRDPARHPAPKGLDGRRLGIYSRLVFNNVSSLLQRFFGKLRQTLSEAAWEQMVRDFFINHRAETPYFPSLAGEFAAYLAARPDAKGLPGFAAELAHYEWLDLALYILDAEAPAAPVAAKRLASARLKLSPLARPLAYQYPVHRIHGGFQPAAPSAQPHCLLMLRDLQDRVRTFELQPLAYQLLSAMEAQPGLVPQEWLDAHAGAFAKQGMDLLESFNQHHLFTETQT